MCVGGQWTKQGVTASLSCLIQQDETGGGCQPTPQPLGQEGEDITEHPRQLYLHCYVVSS